MSLSEMADRIRQWRENPIQFVQESFGVEPDPWQAEALIAIGGAPNPRRRVAMKACTGPGKSAVLSWAGWHRLSCFGDKGEHPKGAALSGEGKDNLRDNLWAELAKWRARSPFLSSSFTWTNERIFANDHKETWFLSARSYAKDADQEAMGRSVSGLHSRYPFILLDEVGDMPITIGQKASQIFTGTVGDALIMGAGNPTSTNGLLHHIFTQERHQWSVTTITGDPDDPKAFFYSPRFAASAASSIQNAREEINKYGRDNPWVMATILGLFPPSGFNSVLSVEEVEAAMKRHLSADIYSWAQKRLGIDVARFGDDRTVIFPRQGLASFRPAEMRHNPAKDKPSVDIANRTMAAKLKWGGEMEFFDDTVGWAHGAIDVMRAAGHSPTAVDFSSRKTVNPRYYNRRAECWLEMAEWIRRGGALPKIPQLARELTAPTYTFKGGQLILEEKEQIKKRLGVSPDLADALALTFALPDMPGQLPYPLNMGQKRGHVSDCDPFEDKDAHPARHVSEQDPFS